MEKQENGRTLRPSPFLLKTITVTNHFARATYSMAIYYTYNQTFLGFCAPSLLVMSKSESKVVRKFTPET